MQRFRTLLTRSDQLVILLGSSISILAATAVGYGVVAGSPALTAMTIVGLLCIPVLIVIEELPLFVFVATLGISQLAIAQDQSLAKPIAILCLGSWLFSLLLRGQNPLDSLSPLDVAILVFFGVNFVSILTASVRDRMWSYLLTYLQNLVLYFMVRTVASSPVRLIRLLWVSVVATTFSASFFLWRFFQGDYLVAGGIRRLLPIGIGVNNYAAFVLSILLIALGLLAAARKPSQRIILASCACILTFTIVVSKSRGAFIGLLAVAPVYLWSVRRRRTSLLGVILITLVFAMVFLSNVSTTLEVGDYSSRMQSLLQTDILTTSRPYLWKMAWRAFIAHPLVGLGVENFVLPEIWFPLAVQVGVPSYIIGPQEPHSLYFGVATDVGLVGLLPFVSMLFIGLRNLITQIFQSQSGKALPLPYTSSILLGFGSYLLAAAFVPSQLWPFLYFLLGLTEAGVRANTAWTNRQA